MTNPNRLRELEATPTPLTSNENVISTLDALNISSSEEMRAARTLKVEPYEYILNEPNACLLRAPFLVILIAVEPKRTDARDAIRKTWGNESMAGDLGFIRLFFMGVNNETQRKGSKLQHTIVDESRQHRDIIQQDYRDGYNNLTLKTLMGMYWITKYCPEATYVMKTDTDMFVNPEYLIQKILKPKGQLTQKYFTGHLMTDYSPNRNKESKWYMPPEVYPGSQYPTFCSGTGYVFSGDMAQRIYMVSLSIPRLHLEDVYVGICLAKLKIEPVPPPNEQLFNHWRVSYSSCKYSNLITSHGFHPNELIQYWQHLQRNKYNPCNSKTKG
ncbi:beta-1,3-galactosyltransferase 2 isoform X2 [Ctenopharyngodon idella]|nr:beta-1,3-galactosyltransferase 2 isoform X2 [Ctenopharyngodon idella]